MSVKRLGLKVVVYNRDRVIIRQRIKIFDSEGNLIKAPIIEVVEKKKYENESVESMKARAEKILKERLKKVISE